MPEYDEDVIEDAERLRFQMEGPNPPYKPSLKEKIKQRVVAKVEEWIHGPPKTERQPPDISEKSFDDMLFYGRHDPRTDYKGGLTEKEHFAESPNKPLKLVKKKDKK